MKLKVLLVTMLGVAGLGSSLALADGGEHHDVRGATTGCTPTHVRGTASAVSLTVTVQKTNAAGPFAPGQVITVSLGSPGDTIRLEAGGCADGSTLTAREAELHVLHQRSTTTNDTTATVTTADGHGHDSGHGHGHDDGHGRGHDHGGTTGASGVTGTTTTDSTTTDSTTTDSTTTTTSG